MKACDCKHVIEGAAARMDLSWDGDNRAFICKLVPNLDLCDYDKQVMRWAYGCDDGESSELKSDGETVVADKFLNGVIKSPAGVVHDYINRVLRHTTPDGKVWTAFESNALYRRIQKALGMTFRARWRRWFGLTISYLYGFVPGLPQWWRPVPPSKLPA
jgi:hypothetical protein